MTPSLPPRAWLGDFVLLAAIWGSSFLFTRVAAAELGAWPTAALRVGIGAACLWPLLHLRGQTALLRQHWRPVLAVGVINAGLPFALYGYAVMSISTGLTSILNATTPLFGALVAWLWLGERPGAQRGTGLAIGFGGVVLLAGGQVGFAPSAAGASPAWAVLAALCATTCYALAASFTKKHIPALPPLVIATGSLMGAALALALPALYTAPTHWPSARAMGALLVLGVVCTALAYTLFFRLVDRAGPARSLTVTFLIPVFALAYGVVLLGEHITLWMLMCGCVIALGTALASGLLAWPQRRAADAADAAD